MIADFHTHILPDIDDGSASLDESLAMLRSEQRQGVQHVVLTPHFYPHRQTPEDFLQARDEAYALLAQNLPQDAPKLYLGAEVYFFKGMSASNALKQLTVAGTQYILVEMPDAPWPESAYRELENIHRQLGLTPIIAHIDRYIRPFHTYGIPERLADLPVLVQANSRFFIDRFTRPLAMKLLRSGKIHLLGSDCHGIHHRQPNLRQAVELIEKKLGIAAISLLCQAEKTVLLLEIQSEP